MDDLPLSHRTTKEFLKRVTFQSFNFTSQPKGCLLQTTKLWEKLTVLNRKTKKKSKAKRTSKLFKLKKCSLIK